jgi:hypothetical protein
MSDIASGFPKNLAYNLKKLDAGFSKTKVKIIPDNQTGQQNSIVRFRITGNGLYDFRSLCMYMTGSCTGGSVDGADLHLPRFSSSLIENISITANNTTLCSINAYNLLYNSLMDIEGADISQMTKRNASGERYDPSTYYSITENDAKNQAISAVNNLKTASGHDTSVPLCINNWLGFLGSLSTPVVDLADIGDVYINIQFAPAEVCWVSNNTTANTSGRTTNPAYSLTDIFMTIDRCSFQDPLYYNLKTEKLLSPEGLNVAYYDYFYYQGSSRQKSSSPSLNFNVNSASLDQVITTFRPKDYQTIYPLVLASAGLDTDVGKTFTQILADPIVGANTGSTTAGDWNTGYSQGGFTGDASTQGNIGDAFNNSWYFCRSGASITGSKFSINSVDIDPYALTKLEVFNKVLQYTGFQNIDLGTSGLHAGILSVHHFAKYYFVDICDLTNISGDNQFWISGLDGRGGGINVIYTPTFNSANTQEVFPVAWCRSTRVLRINAGRQLTLDPPSM